MSVEIGEQKSIDVRGAQYILGRVPLECGSSQIARISRDHADRLAREVSRDTYHGRRRVSTEEVLGLVEHCRNYGLTTQDFI